MLKRKENYTKRTFAEFGITMQQTADINAKIEVFFFDKKENKRKMKLKCGFYVSTNF